MQNKLLIMLSLWAVTTTTWACNGSHVLGAGGAGAVYTISADTMEEGSYFIGINAERVQNETLSDETIINAMQNGVNHIHSIDIINSYSLSVAYGISDKLTLNMQLPYTSRVKIRAGEENSGVYEVHTHGDSKGLGDMSAILQYKVYDENIKIALITGLKVPTGKTDVMDHGETLETDLQPGSGSWDIFAGAALTKDFDHFSLHSNILYKYNTTGVDNSQLGDIFTYNAAISYKLVEHEHDEVLHRLDEEEEFGYSLNIFIELNGESAQKDSFDGTVADNTGHNVVFTTIGLQAMNEAGYALSLTFSKPVYQNFNGIQNDINYKSNISIGKSF